MSRNWTEQEIDYISENWGRVSVPCIARHLGRSVKAIISKKQRLGLGPFILSGEYIPLHQLLVAVTGSQGGNDYILKSWVDKRGLPIHIRRVNKNSVRVVYIQDFWKWAEENRSFIDFSKMEPLILGEEPSWVAEQRKKDFEAFGIQRKDPWTPFEDEKLRYYLSKQEYTWLELSKMLNRSCGAIQRRCHDLNIKDRPVRMVTCGGSSVWTEEMYIILADGIKNGDSYMAIGEKIGKSEKAVRGKVYSVYLTENADKIRKMIGNGVWEDGKPEPNVKQAIHLSRYNAEVKKQLSFLVGLLRYRMNELGYEPYWQRHMCMKWDDLYGCKAGCENCDECVEFERIPPQYCARCGCTFYERIKNRFCLSCRVKRKKKAQRHWAMKNKG